MNNAAKIREAFGMSQEAMAQLLGISVSLLKMVEYGKRNLPSSALPVFDWLLEKAENLSSNPVPENPAHGTDLEIETMVLKKKLRAIESQLSKTGTKSIQNRRLLEMGPQFKAHFSAPEYMSANSRIDAVLAFAAIDVKEEKPKAKILLEMERAGILAMLQFAEEQVSK